MEARNEMKKKVDWDLVLNPFCWFIGWMLCFFIGIFLILISFIPVLNWYILNKLVKSDEETFKTKNPFLK